MKIRRQGIILLCVVIILSFAVAGCSSNNDGSKNKSSNEKFDYKNAVAYQIYPMSFKDSDGDGIGDIKGIISKLDYLKDLGINLIWICPMYNSPMDDNGYDISDYDSINPMFGNMDDMQELIDKAKDKGIGIMMDLVVNHTSDEYSWFKEALKNPKSKYRNYYYFKKGDENGNPPSNWRSVFGGNVWEKVPNEDNMYYFHSFSKKQPDLNWANADMRNEIKEMISRWMKRGIVGFRVDAINFIKKSEFKNYPADNDDGLVSCFDYTRNVNGIEKYYKYIKDMFDSNNCVTVSEAVGVPYDSLNSYIGKNGTFSMMFDFAYTELGIKNENYFETVDWSIKDLKEKLDESQISIQKTGWSAPFLENHDQARSVNKYIKNKDYYYDGAKALAVMNMFLRGTPFIYQGEELGTLNFERKDVAEFNDIKTKDQYSRALEKGFNENEALSFCNANSRDNARTPFAWTNDQYGGFTSGKPWIGMSYENPKLNAKDEAEDKDSILNFYKEIISLRKNHKVFINGSYEKIDVGENVISYKRVNNEESVTVLVNLSDKETPVSMKYKEVLCDTHNNFKNELAPYQAVVLKN